MDDYRPHTHYTDPIDLSAKSIAIGGALLLLGIVGAGGEGWGWGGWLDGEASLCMVVAGGDDREVER